MSKKRLFLALATTALVVASSQAQTYIRAVLPNPSNKPATGYHFEIITPGKVLDATASTSTVPQPMGDARYTEASVHSLPSVIKGLRETASSMSLPFTRPVAPNERVDLRIAFTPKEYWRVYFQDVFEYSDGHTERSKIPYAAFFINYAPTKEAGKKHATLTVVNNVASSYGISKSVVNDDARRPIVFRNARVYVNNSREHYDLAHFDRPDGVKVDLPSSFVLKAGEAQTFDLGLVNANSYVLTLSEISYEGSEESFPIACSHPDDDESEQASTQYRIFAPHQQ